MANPTNHKKEQLAPSNKKKRKDSLQNKGEDERNTSRETSRRSFGTTSRTKPSQRISFHSAQKEEKENKDKTGKQTKNMVLSHSTGKRVVHILQSSIILLSIFLSGDESFVEAKGGGGRGGGGGSRGGSSGGGGSGYRYTGTSNSHNNNNGEGELSRGGKIAAGVIISILLAALIISGVWFACFADQSKDADTGGVKTEAELFGNGHNNNSGNENRNNNAVEVSEADSETYQMSPEELEATGIVMDDGKK